MPHYTASIEIARPVAELFAFYSKPANLVALTPPELKLELVTAPEVIELGSQLVWKARRWGITQRIVQQVTLFDVEKSIVTEQTQGRLPRWIHGSQFTASAAGTLIQETIEFEPPGGLLGMMVSADAIRKELDALFAYRSKKLSKLFG